MEQPVCALGARCGGGSVTAMLRIAIADDHALFRQGLKGLLHLESDVRVVAEVDRVDDIVPMIERTPCDILLLDFQMDRHTLAELERFTEKVRVAVLTASEQLADAIAAFRAGARAVIFKRFAVETLMEALRAAARGEIWMPHVLQTQIVNEMREPPRLITARERDIIRHVALGLRNAEVAQRLLITEQTVKTHLNKIFQKVGVRDRVELAIYAARVGIVGLHDRPS